CLHTSPFTLYTSSMRFQLFVALRYLKAKRRQAVISVITVISVLGVAAGVGALVVALAINNGFRQELENRLLGATSNINLIRPAARGQGPGQVARRLRRRHGAGDQPARVAYALRTGTEVPSFPRRGRVRLGLL